MHAKIVDQGPPDDAMPGIKNIKVRLFTCKLRELNDSRNAAQLAIIDSYLVMVTSFL
jgi:hypothetical protein